MSVKDAIMAALDASPNDTVRGRTLLQKKLYFVSVLTGEDFGYEPYFYGPYSSLVADELGALESAGFIEEQAQPLYLAGPFGDRYRYDYQLTSDSKAFIDLRHEEMTPYQAALARVNSHPVSDNSLLLSVAAKVHLIVSEQGKASITQVRERAQQLGWNLSKDDVKAVAQYLEQLGLLKWAAAGR